MVQVRLLGVVSKLKVVALSKPNFGVSAGFSSFVDGDCSLISGRCRNIEMSSSVNLHLVTKKLEELVLPDTDILSPVACYEQLVADKDENEPLSDMVKFKRIVDAILGFYGLVVDTEYLGVLKTDDEQATLIYRPVSPVFKEKYVFYLQICQIPQDDFLATLMRRRVLTPEMKKVGVSLSSVHEFVEIHPKLLPSLIDVDREDDLAQIMNIIQLVVHSFGKIWTLNSIQEPNPCIDANEGDELMDETANST